MRDRAVRLLDASALLACSAYVDLNPIRAALAETLEQSDDTSIHRRIQAVKQQVEDECLNSAAIAELDENAGTSMENDQSATSSADTQRKEKASQMRDRSLAPIHLDELRDALQILPSTSSFRCSNRVFLDMSAVKYIELLDWLARQVVPGKRGSTPEDAPAVFERLGLDLVEPQSSAATFCELVANFGKLFKIVAGKPHVIDAHRGVRRLDGSVIAGYCI